MYFYVHFPPLMFCFFSANQAPCHWAILQRSTLFSEVTSMLPINGVQPDISEQASHIGVFILSSTRRAFSRASCPWVLTKCLSLKLKKKKTFLQHMLFLTKSQETWSTCSSEAVHQLRLECRLTRPRPLCTVPPAHCVLTTTADSLKQVYWD